MNFTNNTYHLTITCARGVEDLLQQEIKNICDADTSITNNAVFLKASLEQAYKICLWSRLANKVLLQLAKGPTEDRDDLYNLCQTISWLDHMNPDNTFAFTSTGTNKLLKHENFIALVAKDALVDQFQEELHQRPNVDRENPQIVFHVHIDKDIGTIYLDFSGGSLHKRGYRGLKTEAPLKETLATAILYRSHWHVLCEKGYAFFDPMCGSGTLTIEAALIASNTAPGLLRKQFGFDQWKNHDIKLWKRIRTQCQQQKRRLKNQIIAYDQDKQAIAISKQNATMVSLHNSITFSSVAVHKINQTNLPQNGLLVTNPPYGQRIGSRSQLPTLYANLGNLFKPLRNTWHIAIFSMDKDLLQTLGQRADKMNHLYNGKLRCFLAQFTPPKQPDTPQQELLSGNDKDQLHAFSNRLRKNEKQLQKWITRESISCYRIYDADIPEYNVAIDYFENKWLHVQEYQAPKDIPIATTKKRLAVVLQSLTSYFKIPPDNIFVKHRKPQKGKDQYKQLDKQRNTEVINESGARFLVNFTDYLDPGIFLDHRLVRNMIAREAKNKHVLNLFAYTATTSVLAAIAGAKTTTSVDSSKTYCQWAASNFSLNRIDTRKHAIVRSDCLEWLASNKKSWDIIFCDPPSFSNSKSRSSSFDVQRDHGDLIALCMKKLKPDGQLWFSNNLRSFKLDQQVSDTFHVQDISKASIPPDFKRRPNIHKCYVIRHK